MKNFNRISMAAALVVIASAFVSTSTFASSCHSDHSKATKAKSEEASQKKDTYPLKTCIVSDEELGSMGDYYSYDHEGREVRFCCKMCKKDFLKDPAKYLAKLDKAAKEADKSGSSSHKVSDKKSDGGGHDHHAH